MNYSFPEIRAIDDVLPHIEGRDEFIVAEREFGTVINYMVQMPDTFDMVGPDDLGGAIRRECRGLIFWPDGRIMSRPFHKFHNVGEREETQINEVDIRQPHVVMEKMDGSMIRPIIQNGYLRLATKMGLSDQAIQAERWLQQQHGSLQTWLRKCVEEGKTPIFEWVSPKNQIVLHYDQPDLVLLAIRDNTTGEYSMPDTCPFTVVPQYGSVDGGFSEYIERQREAENREGDIIRFSTGHMLKVKNDWYVRIHKALDSVRFDRNIVDLIINEQLDDVIGLMPQQEIERIRAFECQFWEAFDSKKFVLESLCDEAKTYSTRKEVALNFVPTIQCKADAPFIFRMLDGHNIRTLMLEHIEKNISTNTRWEECARWLGM